MALLDQLMPFESAVKTLSQRGVLPTALDSAGLRQLGGAFHRQNFTSALHALVNPLERLREAVGSVLNPTTEQRADRVTPQNPQGNVTVGMNPADARLAVKEALRKEGYEPKPDERGTIKDLSSDARINLQIKTNVELHQGAGFAVQSNDPAVLEAFPCWELYRLETKKTQRDWPGRWRVAARLSGDIDAARVLETSGRMVARKDSPIWQSLGDGDGGYEDTLGNPYPPFAFNSGMWTRNVAYDDAESLGLVNLQTKVESSLSDDLAQLFKEAA
jgi:hypothetical protein